MNSISRERIGVAFIGAGIVAEMHGRGVAASANARLLGAYDPRREKAKAIARRFGGRVYNALDDVFADARVQAVHILTSPEHHVSVALRALQHGKHVLVEKPV